jgi:hypothetical protein
MNAWCCCKSQSSDAPPPGLLQLNMALVLGGPGAPDIAHSDVRAAESGEYVCPAGEIFLNSGGAPAIMFAPGTAVQDRRGQATDAGCWFRRCSSALRSSKQAYRAATSYWCATFPLPQPSGGLFHRLRHAILIAGRALHMRQGARAGGRRRALQGRRDGTAAGAVGEARLGAGMQADARWQGASHQCHCRRGRADARGAVPDASRERPVALPRHSGGFGGPQFRTIVLP